MAGVVSALVVASGAARAGEPAPAAPSEGLAHGNYYGAFWGFDLRAGAAFGVADSGLEPDVAVGGSFRIAGLMSLIDVDVSAVTSGFARRIRGDAYDERHTRIGVEARLHPLFMRTLEGAWVLAGIHLALGGGCDILSSVGGGHDRTDVGFAFQFGAGVDVPLTSPKHRKWSLWLGFGWRMRFVGFAHAPAGLRDLGGQDAFVTVGFRGHSIDFMRIPTPPEFNDSDR